MKTLFTPTEHWRVLASVAQLCDYRVGPDMCRTLVDAGNRLAQGAPPQARRWPWLVVGAVVGYLVRHYGT